MQLESLANELLLDLFEFLKGVHLLRAFHGLNSRFDNLLFTYFQSNPLDFRSVSKTDFDLVCQQHLPSLVDRITSLCLSDDNETPHQTQCFFSYHFTLGQFIHLQSLLLSHIYSEQTMDQMMDELCHLSQLRHLSIRRCKFQSSYVDTIWRLPRLIHCELESIGGVDWSNIPTVKSLSLQRLDIQDSRLRKLFLGRLSEFTPCLRHLTAQLLDDFPIQQLTLMISSIETLNLSFLRLTHGLENLVAHMPNLSQLTVKTLRSSYLDGSQWETMITDHLPRLKVFRLLMKFTFKDDMDGEEQVDQILDSFRTRFWIDEHQWFVRCHWGLELESKCFYLYTLPYTFPRFLPNICMRFKSTCSEDADYCSYDRVHDIIYRGSLSTDFIHLRFSKLHSLHLSLPIQEHFWSIVPILDQLTSLILDFDSDASVPFPLQALVDGAPRLYSLTFNQDLTSHAVNLTSKSIRRLAFEFNETSFNEEKCIALSRSSLGMQCEFLWIKVQDKTNIVHLVNNMKNLRALCFTCEDDGWKRERMFDRFPLPEDEIILWLQQHFPSTCSISRHPVFPYFAKMWIG